MHAAVIDDSCMGTNDGAYLIASGLPGLNNRTNYVQTELVSYSV